MATVSREKCLGVLSVMLLIVSLLDCVGTVSAGQFTRVKNAQLISIFSTFTTRSAQECCQICARNNDCIAVNYRVQSDECQLSQTTPQTGRTAYNVPDWDVIYRTDGMVLHCSYRVVKTILYSTS